MAKKSLKEMFKSAEIAAPETRDERERFVIETVTSEKTGAVYLLRIIQDKDAETITLNRFIPVCRAAAALLEHYRLGAYPQAEPGLHIGTRQNSPDLPVGWISSDHDPEIHFKNSVYTVERMPLAGWAPFYVMGRKATAGTEIAFNDAIGQVIYQDRRTGLYPSGARTGYGFILEKDANLFWYHFALDMLLQGHNLELHVVTRSDGSGSWPYVQQLLRAWDAPTIEEARQILSEAVSDARYGERAFRSQYRIGTGQRFVNVDSYAEYTEPETGKPMLQTLDGRLIDPDTLRVGQRLAIWNSGGKLKLYTWSWSPKAEYNENFVLDLLERGQKVQLL